MPLLNLTLDPHFRLNRKNRLEVQLLDPRAPGWKLFEVVPKLFRRTLGLNKAARLYRVLQKDERQVPFFQKAVDAFDLKIAYSQDSLDRIPQKGPLIVVANHPLNGIDGLAIGHLITQVRSDVKAMLTATFDGIPGIAPHGIFVYESKGPSAHSRSEPIRQAIDYLRAEGVVVLFPAGQGSYLKESGRPDPVDVRWMPGVSLLIRKSQAPVLPIYVHGAPGKMYLILRRFLPQAAIFNLLNEIVRQTSTIIRLTVGDTISHERMLEEKGPEELVMLLREKTYDLGKVPSPCARN